MNDGPDVILIGGTDELRLDDDANRVYHPGDVMPRTLTHEKRLSLQAAGIRFATRHDEPSPRKPARAPAAQEAPPVEDEAEKPRRAAKES